MKRYLPYLILVLNIVLFNLLFWQENLGPNLAIYAVASCIGAVLVRPAILQRRVGWILAAGVVMASASMVWLGSDAAAVAVFASTITFWGAVLAPDFKSVPTAISTGFFNAVLAYIPFLTSLLKRKNTVRKQGKMRAYLRVSVLPLVIFFLFYLLFFIANPKVNDFSTNFFSNIGYWFAHFPDFWPRLGMSLVGLVIGIAFLWNSVFQPLMEWDLTSTEKIHRKRLRAHQKYHGMGLKRELRVAILTVAMVNILLFVVNLIDISWLWFGYTPSSGTEMHQLVHEGTYVLIISILIAMGIMFYFFRGNLNFLRDSKLLKILSYIWIGQNIILVLSVAIRNYHFIHSYGLAYKRIGVAFFLLLTVFGLITLFLKIRNQKSFYYIIRTNSWAVYGLVIMLAMVNWDGVIATHNLKNYHTKEIERGFLLHLSDKTLPVLMENLDAFGTRTEEEKYHYRYPHPGYFNDRAYLEDKLKDFIYSYRQTSWLSHSIKEANAYQKLKNHPLLK